MKQNSYLMLFYGIFLLTVAVLTVAIVGWSAKTALFSGGSMGLLAIVIAHFINKKSKTAYYAGLVQTVFLSFIFGWRAWMALKGTLELTASNSIEEIPGKMTAFFVINLMLAISVAFSGIQFSNIMPDISKKS